MDALVQRGNFTGTRRPETLNFTGGRGGCGDEDFPPKVFSAVSAIFCKII